MSASPLKRLLEDGQVQTLLAPEADAFVSSATRAVLVFTGDPAHRPEAQDVAVIVRELQRQVAGLRVGVVALADEAALKPRFHVQAVPAVVFLKDGRAVSTLDRVQDWSAYARAAAVLFGQKLEATP